MGLVLGDNFSYGGAKPLDARLKYDTLADMVGMAESTLYDGCMAYCVGSDKTYQWKSSNDTDETLAKWREFTSGGGSSESSSIISLTLLASGWSENSQTLTASGVSSSSIGAIGVPDSITSAQLTAIKSAVISVTSVSTDSITFACENTPEIDLPISVLICGAYSTSGGGGTSDYTQLSNLPQINGVTLTGDKSTSDLGISYNDISDTPTIPTVDQSYSASSTNAQSGVAVASAISTKQNTLTAGTNIGISGTTISATNTISLNFSTSEQAIGTWIDGATLYQKTISCGALPNATTKSTSTGLSGIRPRMIYGYAYNTSGNTQPLPTPGNASLSGCRVVVQNSGSTIAFQSASDWSSFTESYITILYTK